MIERLARNGKGYVRIELWGYSPERFLNLCSAREIEIWDIRCNADGRYECCMLLRDFRQIRPLVRKAGVRLSIRARAGLPFFLHKNRRRWWYGAGICAFFLFLYIMSLFIWDIRIEGEYHYTRDTLLQFLASMDVESGTLKARLDCGELEEALRAAFPEITWVSAGISGNRLFIRVKENEVLSRIPEKEETPSDLVAAKSGVITSIVVRSGTARTAVGQEVEEGQVLVEGRVSIVGDNGEELRAYLIPADGDVTARIVETYEKEIPLFHEARTATGRERSGAYIRIGPWSFTFLMPAGGNGEWDYFMEERQLTLFSDFCLPVYLGNIRGREMVSYEKNYGQDELAGLAQMINEQTVKNLEEKGVHILENNDRIETSPSGWRIIGRLVTEQSIVRRAPVEEKGLME